jgi:uncharacterized membrane protein HdeD (DUF308 family)
MSHQIAHAWSVLLIRGICNVLFALVAFLQPGLTLVALVLLWAIYVVVDGAMSLTTGIAARRGGDHSWSLILAGASGLVAGLVAFVWPGVTIIVLLAIMAVWAIVRGSLEIAAAIWLRYILPRAWMLALSGGVSVLFGVLLIERPAIGLVTLVYLAGAASLVSGILAIALAMQLRRGFSEPHGGGRRHVPA